MKRIILGEHTGLTWECQLTDFGSHFVQQIDGSVPTIFKEVCIGDYCWIGNRTTVQPGTRLPNRTIVASNSLLNKDYTRTLAPHSLIGGMPARLLREGLTRIYDVEEERALLQRHRPTPPTPTPSSE